MKLPFFQMYPSDYLRDTRVLSLAAKGGWFDVLCMLHSSSIRGTMTLPLVGWARVMAATVDQAEAVVAELDGMKIADVTRLPNGDVTLTSRRMLREHITREQTRLRVARHRQKANAPNGNAFETGQKAETKKPETKKNTSDLATAPPPQRERNSLLDALCLHAELTDPLTAPKAIWPKLGRALQLIRAATPGVTPAEIERRAVNYGGHFDASITSTALAAHWGRCDIERPGKAVSWQRRSHEANQDKF